MTAIKYINDCYRYSGGSSSSTLIKTAGAAWVGYQVGIMIVIMIIIIMGWIPGENNLEPLGSFPPTIGFSKGFPMSRIYFGCIFRWEKPLHNSPTGTMVVGGTMTGTGRCPIAHSHFSLNISYVFHFYSSWREKEGQLCRNNSDCNWLHKDLKVIFTLCIKHELSYN